MKKPKVGEKIKVSKDLTVEVVITEKSIKYGIKNLAGKIAKDYEGEKPILIIVLNGGMYFGKDLSTHLGRISFDHDVDFIRIKRYEKEFTAGEPKIFYKPGIDLAGRHIIFVDQMCDDGDTLSIAEEYAKEQGVATFCHCVLIEKEREQLGYTSLFVEYKVFDHFPKKIWGIGYGLDEDGKYRYLTCVCKKENSN